jgi:hypothetical protein
MPRTSKSARSAASSSVVVPPPSLSPATPKVIPSFLSPLPRGAWAVAEARLSAQRIVITVTVKAAGGKGRPDMVVRSASFAAVPAAGALDGLKAIARKYAQCTVAMHGVATQCSPATAHAFNTAARCRF